MTKNKSAHSESESCVSIQKSYVPLHIDIMDFYKPAKPQPIVPEDWPEEIRTYLNQLKEQVLKATGIPAEIYQSPGRDIVLLGRPCGTTSSKKPRK